jgi:hypothetical protein
MQTFAGREMSTWGYPPEQVHLSPIEAMLYCTVDWPFGVMRMALS